MLPKINELKIQLEKFNRAYESLDEKGSITLKHSVSVAQRSYSILCEVFEYNVPPVSHGGLNMCGDDSLEQKLETMNLLYDSSKYDVTKRKEAEIQYINDCYSKIRNTHISAVAYADRSLYKLSSAIGHTVSYEPKSPSSENIEPRNIADLLEKIVNPLNMSEKMHRNDNARIAVRMISQYKSNHENELSNIPFRKSEAIKKVENKYLDDFADKIFAPFSFAKPLSTDEKAREVSAFIERFKNYNEDTRVSISRDTENLNKQFEDLFQGQWYSDFKRDYVNYYKNAGLDKRNWSSYIPGTVSDEFVVGKSYEPISGKFNGYQRSVIQRYASWVVSDGYIAAPLTFRTNESKNILIRCMNKAFYTKASELVQLFILQKLRLNDVNRVNVYFADPDGMGRNLGCLNGEKSSNAEICVFSSNLKSETIDLLLSTVKQIEEINSKLQSFNSIYSYNLAHKSDPIKETVLVLFNVELCVSKGQEEQYLQTIIQNSSRCGINVICVENCDYDPKEKLYYDRSSFYTVESAELIDFENAKTCSSWNISLYNCSYDMRGFVADYRKKTKEKRYIKSDFSSLYNINAIEVEDSTNGISLPILVENKPLGIVKDFNIGTLKSTHTLITGGTGSGKSTFLHAIISNIILRYHPDDVELWLVDYGVVEFQKYVENRSKHISLLCLEKTEEFTFAFLEYLQDVFRNREAEFLRAGCTNIKEYRQKFGKHSMPRIVLVVDEFHVMVQHCVMEREYYNMLVNALKEYRKFGLSCIFSDQSYDAISKLGDGLDQIRNRVAMSNENITAFKETLGASSEEISDEQIKKTKIGELWYKEYVNDRDYVFSSYKALYMSDDDISKSLRVSSVKYTDSDSSSGKNFITRISKERPKFVADMLRQAVEKESYDEDYVSLVIGEPTTLNEYQVLKLSRIKRYQNVFLSGSDNVLTVDILKIMIYNMLIQHNMEVCIFADRSYYLTREIMAFANKICIKATTDINEICFNIQSMIKRDNPSKNLTVFWIGFGGICDQFSRYGSAKHSTSAVENSGTISVDESELMNDTELNDIVKNASDSSGLGLSLEGFLQSLSVKNDDKPRDSSDVYASDTDYRYNAADDVLKLFQDTDLYGAFNIVQIEDERDIERIHSFDPLNYFDFQLSSSLSRDSANRLGFPSGVSTKISELDKGLNALIYDRREYNTFRPYSMNK